MTDLPRWTSLIRRLKGMDKPGEGLSRKKGKSPEMGQNEGDRGKGRGG